MSGALPERRMSTLTLGVNDRAAMKRFYEGVLGFADVGPETLTVYDLGGFAFCLWEREKLAADAGLADGEARGVGSFPGFTLGYNARTEAEVDGIFARLEAAGAAITVRPHKTFWGGYSGYFTDPEGHAWEVAFNPFWPVQQDGRLRLPAGGAA